MFFSLWSRLRICKWGGVQRLKPEVSGEMWESGGKRMSRNHQRRRRRILERKPTLRAAAFVNTTNHNSSDTLWSSWCYCPNVSTAPLSECVFIEKYIRKEKNVRRWVFPRCDMEAIYKMCFISVWKAFTVSHFDMFHQNDLSMLKQTCKEKKEDVFQTLQKTFLAFVHFLPNPLKNLSQSQSTSFTAVGWVSSDKWPALSSQCYFWRLL